METINVWLILSGVSAILTGVGHSFLGEARLIGPVLAHPVGVLKDVVRQRILRNVFHLPSVNWILMGIMTIVMAFTANPSKLPLFFALAVYVTSLMANVQAVRGWHIGWFLLLINSSLLLLGIFRT